MHPLSQSIMRMGGQRDPYSPSVTFLAHMNGANNGVVFTDEKGAVATVFGVAKTSTVISKFNGSSGLFDTAGSYLEYPGIAGYDMGNGDFTIDAWFYPTNLVALNTLLRYAISGNEGSQTDLCFLFYLNNPGLQGVLYFTDGTYANVASAVVPTLNAWNFMRATRSGTNWSVAMNGVSLGTDATAGTKTINTPATRLLRICRHQASTPRDLIGNLAEVRITKGVARSLLEVPVNPFSNY